MCPIFILTTFRQVWFTKWQVWRNELRVQLLQPKKGTASVGCSSRSPVCSQAHRRRTGGAQEARRRPVGDAAHGPHSACVTACWACTPSSFARSVGAAAQSSRPALERACRPSLAEMADMGADAYGPHTRCRAAGSTLLFEDDVGQLLLLLRVGFCVCDACRQLAALCVVCGKPRMTGLQQEAIERASAAHAQYDGSSVCVGAREDFEVV
jgi:hypothetical protein